MILRLLTLLASLAFFCSFASAQPVSRESEPSAHKSYEELEQEIVNLKAADQIRDIAIKNLIRRIEQLERLATGRQPADQLPSTAAEVSIQPDLSTEEKEQLRVESEANNLLIQTAFEQRLGREGGMVNAPFQLTYTPSFSYSYASYDSIVVDGFTIYPVLVIGDIVSEKIRRDIVTNNHSFRLGLPGKMQFDLVVPLGYERKRTFREDGTHSSYEADGLGDISMGLSYQLIEMSSFWPDTVIGLNWKSTSGEDPYRQQNTDVPTLGSGFETWSLSMTSIAIADPVVLFGGLSTTYTPGRGKSIGHVKPGQSAGINLGMVIALNLDTSLSFNYNYNYTLETEINRQTIKGSDLVTSSFSIGLSRAKNDLFATDIDLAIGLTQDSTDFQFTVSFPLSFSLSDVSP